MYLCMSIDMLYKIISTAYQGEDESMKDQCAQLDKLSVALSRHILGSASTKKRFEAMVS